MMAVVQVARSLLANLEFAAAMAARNLKGLAAGSVLGLAWLVLRPLVHVGAYVVIIAYILRVKFEPDAGSFDYLLYVLSGMVAWQAVQQSFEQAPSLIRERMDIIQQVVYPIETLPVTAMLTGWIGPLVGLVAYVGLALGLGRLPWTAVLLPIPIGLLVVLVLGGSWLFMIAGVLLKDLRDMLVVLFGLLVYCSPVLLSEAMVGAHIWNLILLNPLSHIVICFRDVLQGTLHASSWTLFGGLACAAFMAGAWAVSRAKVLINEYI